MQEQICTDSSDVVAGRNFGDRFDAEVGIHINLAQGKLNLARTTRWLKAL